MDSASSVQYSVTDCGSCLLNAFHFLVPDLVTNSSEQLGGWFSTQASFLDSEFKKAGCTVQACIQCWGVEARSSLGFAESVRDLVSKHTGEVPEEDTHPDL